MTINSDPTRGITGVCRSSYMFCRELTRQKDDDPLTVRTSILIPKKDKATVKAIKDAIKAAAQKKFGPDVKIKAKSFGIPLRDGDQELEDEEVSGKEYKDHYFMSAKGYKLPGVVDENGSKVEDPSDLDAIIVSGFYYRFSLTFRGYDIESKGVRAVLNNIMFIKEGERLDGGSTAEEDFGEFASASADEDEDEGDGW